MEEEDHFSSSTPPALRLRWDVFLSFRGEDTRDNFTDRLYSALDTRGVRVFRDNNALTQGDQINQGLLDAIDDSAAAIAIISANYASSRWCLEELAHIFQSPRRVLPVFYRVDPSHVRRQGGPFKKDFEALEERFGVPKVVRWRKAMERVGGISGWVYNNSEESDLIQNIVKRILAELSNSPVVVASYVVGLNFRLEDLVGLLDVKQNGLRVLGLHGLGGIGKTTLAKALYNKLARHFQCRSFLSSVRENFKNQHNGPEFLQKKIVDDLSSHKVPTSFDAKSFALEMKRILKQNRVLLVLDDIDDAGQLKALAGSREWYSEGGRIVITTRDAAALPTDFVDGIYEVKPLGDSESLKLFSHHALRRENPTGTFLKLSRQIVSCTGGLPLALEVFGSLLFGKRRVEEWQDALEKLKQIRATELQGALKISYDALDVEEQSIFLDIACLLLNLEMSREDVIDALRGSYFGVETAITTLVSRSLIKFIDDGQLWMHDQIRDMGRQIILEENPSDVYRRSRIWNPADVLGLFQGGKGTRDIQGITLDLEKKNFSKEKKAQAIAWQQLCRAPNFTSAITYLREIYKEHHHHYATKDGEVTLNAMSFESMVNLRLLQFSNVKLEGRLKRLPAQLKWLQWRQCSLRSFPPDFFPRELAVLDLSESKIERIWGWKWCWYARQVSNNLMVMNLRRCHNITEIPDLSGHEKLEKLILERCTKLEKIHQSMGDLRSLRHLSLNHCSSLIDFPEDVSGLKNVEILTLSGCTKLRSLPKNIECMISLRVLLLDDTVIGHLPENIFRLTKLERLSLERCSSLKQLPRLVGKLISLREISLYNSALEEIPESFGSLRNLEILNLMWCKSLTAIPECVDNLKSLTKFYLTSSSVKFVPSSIGNLYYLKELSLGECPHMKMLPASIEGLSSMTELQLDNTQITGLPDQIGALKSVKKLEMRNCQLLCSLPDSFGNMWALETLIITNAAIKELPVSIGSLENLCMLRLNKCKKLHRLPDSFGDLRNLRCLFMEDTAMTELPETVGMLLNLMVLKMAKKPDVQLAQSTEPIHPVIDVEVEPILLPSSFSELISLQEFDARAWKISGQLPDNFEKLTSLEILNLSHNDFTSLPSSMSGLSVLRKLFLSSCNKLKVLPPLPSSLLEIDASNCIALKSMHSLSNLKCLRELNLINCEKLVDIPGIECLKSLRWLHMIGCSSCAQAVRKIDKVSLKNLCTLSFPGSEVPEWLTSDVVNFSKRKNISLKGVIIGVVISVDCGVPVDSRHQLPVVCAKILRLNETVYTSGMYLRGVPRTDEDQTYLCRYEEYHPLVSMLKDGDKIEVEMQTLSIFEGLELKKRGIHFVFENDDDYDGDEELLDQSQQSISEKLRRFIDSPQKTDLITGSRGENKEPQKHVSDCFEGILGYAKYKSSLIVLVSLVLGIIFAWWLKV